MVEHSSDRMFTLFTFLRDGLPYETYVNFLLSNRMQMQGNVSELIKDEEDVILSIDPNSYTDLPQITIKSEALIYLLKEWNRLVDLETDKISLILNEDSISVIGERQECVAHSQL